ncbi:MAG: FMN-binding protein, partial [Verrucomicrobiota bacterium]|nr:FMN-binding protein [Verrucomicrobiota bacterium]
MSRFLALSIIVGLIHLSHQDFLLRLQETGQVIEFPEVRDLLPRAFSLNESPNDSSELWALDENDTRIGVVTQTSPTGDSAVGFSGSTNLLVIWDEQDRVSSVSIRSSGDTIDHLNAILEKPTFFEQFVGKSREGLAQLDEVSAVSGATLTSLAIADALALRFGGTKKNSRFPNPIDMEEIRKHFPQAVGLTPSKTHPSMLQVTDANGSALGAVGRTSPHADQIIGYQGPIDS